MWIRTAFTVAACAALAGYGGTARNHTSPTAHHTSPSPPEPTVTLKAISSVAVPIDAPPLFAGFGAVWSASSSGLVELSPTTASARILVRQPVDDIALSDSFVYALSATRGEVLEFDPRSRRVRRSWHVPRGAPALTVGGGAVYVAYSSGAAAIERIDLASGAVTRTTIPKSIGIAQGQAIAYGDATLWVIDGSTLYAVDPIHLSLRRSLTLSAQNIWFGDGALWSAVEQENSGIDRIDPATLHITATLASDSYQIGFSPTMVFFSAVDGPVAVDPQTGRKLAALPTRQVLSNGSAGIAVVGKQVWTTYGDIRRLQRIALVGVPPGLHAARSHEISR
jgi:hypothetical protein